MFLVNRRLGLVSAAPSRSSPQGGVTLPGRPFSRSYGANLPSSLTGVLSSTSVYSTSPPVSVCGTGAQPLARGFSRRYGVNAFGAGSPPCLTLPSRLNGAADLPAAPAYRVGGSEIPAPSPPRPPIARNGVARDGNLDPLSIACGSRLRLRPASPAADQHGGGTLGHSVGGIRAPLALLMPTFALPSAPPRLPPRLHGCWGRSPTIARNLAIRGFGRGLEPRWIVGAAAHPARRPVRPVSYYALFKGWLLLSQPPGCLRAATALPT